MDTQAVVLGVLAVSVVGHVISGYFNYKILGMVLRAIAPSLRHRTEPMPQLRAPYHSTDRLDEEAQMLVGTQIRG